MKKILIVLIVMMCMCVSIFGSVNLTLNSQIECKSMIKLSSVPLQLGQWWNNENEDLTLTFNSPDALTGYVNLRTNSHNWYYVKISGSAMESTGNTTKIGYTITPIDNGDDDGYTTGGTLDVDDSGDTSEVLHFITFPGIHGLRVVPAEFSVELNAEDWENAGEGEYSADVTFFINAP